MPEKLMPSRDKIGIITDCLFLRKKKMENIKTKQTYKCLLQHKRCCDLDKSICTILYKTCGTETLTRCSTVYIIRHGCVKHLACAKTYLLSPLKWMELTLLMCPLSSFFVVSRTFGASAMSPQMSCNVLSATFFFSSWQELWFCVISRKASQV